MHPACIIWEPINVYVIVIGVCCCFIQFQCLTLVARVYFKLRGAQYNIPCFCMNTSNTLLFQSKVFVGAIPIYNIAVASHTRRLSRISMLLLANVMLMRLRSRRSMNGTSLRSRYIVRSGIQGTFSQYGHVGPAKIHPG